MFIHHDHKSIQSISSVTILLVSAFKPFTYYHVNYIIITDEDCKEVHWSFADFQPREVFQCLDDALLGTCC